MSYAVEELSPAKPILIIDGTAIDISLITLQHEVIFKDQYGSLSNVFKVINEKPDELVNVIFILIADKKAFQNKLEVFRKFCFTSKDSIKTWAQKMMACFNASVASSMPLVRNAKRMKELQEIKAGGENKPPCYAVYFDSIAKRYGFTLEQFYNLTLRNIHIMLHTIGDESYKEVELQAALLGRKLKPKMDFKDISEEEEIEQEDHAMEALKKLQEDYKKNNNKG